MEGWKELLIAGLGGGAIQEFLDQFVSMLPGQIAGIQLKDIASIFLFKYLADKTSGNWRTLFQGAGVIALYKSVYANFVKPMLSGILGGVAPTTTTTTTTTAPVTKGGSALAAAQLYVASKGVIVR
jgi:hypothetical protein